MAALGLARVVVMTFPFERWRSSLGADGSSARADLAQAQRLAAYIEWAARLVPFKTRCLHQAMALSWILRRKHIGHVVVFAARPAQLRGSDDDLHAWVEAGGQKLIGDLPGPWLETLRAGHSIPDKTPAD